MTPCTFLFDPEFQFHDGDQKRKIFVVLNSGSCGTYLAAKTTSQSDRYGIQHGCQILDRFPNFHLVHGSCCLDKNTWIQLDSFYEFHAGELFQKAMSGAIYRIGNLSAAQAMELLTCASHAVDLTPHQESMVAETISSLIAEQPEEASNPPQR